MAGPLWSVCAEQLSTLARTISVQGATTMTKASDLVKRFEGLRLKAYQCPAGIWTIGYGSTANVHEGDTISMVRAEALLVHDLAMAELIIDQNVRYKLNPNQRAALTSFVFNVGRRNFIRSTMIKRLNAKNYDAAAGEFARWTYATNPKSGKKEKLAGLISRRAEEKHVFETPE